MWAWLWFAAFSITGALLVIAIKGNQDLAVENRTLKTAATHWRRKAEVAESRSNVVPLFRGEGA